MSWVQQRYQNISPVTLQVVGGAMSSSLYCGEVEGLSLVESYLVELYRCKLCKFTCGLMTAINSHMLLRHRPLTLTCLGTNGRDRAGLQEDMSPYQLELNADTKQSDEDEDFLLYNMLDNMSPPTCDISSQEGLHVAHTCEVSTLFEEEEEEEEEEHASIFPLKQDAMDLSGPVQTASIQEDMDQSAHLMTLGLCRTSAVKPPPPPAASPLDYCPPAPADPAHLQRNTGRRLLCLLCPLTLPSRRLLDVHVRSHRAGGFSCIRCSWTSDTWEELESHWRRHCRRRRRRRRWEEEEVSQRRKRRTEQEVSQRRTATRSLEQWRSPVIGQVKEKEVELPERLVPSLTSKPQTGPPQSVSKMMKKSRRKKNEEVEAESLSCSLCYRKFSSNLTLRRHRGVHGGEKPFTCPHCPYNSRLKASLLQHLRTHTGEKPYRCSECPYASIDRSSLLRHCRTHSQEKPYSCQLCNYSSIQKKSLDLHARRHHTGEVFPCQQCEYSSPDRQLLLKHISRHHSPSQQAGL
ncbi:histone-lysine N-methyltransferase PRDM9 [Melanotaenia boesemani]|uniref:histone-lysine N-methyltransferase PRDM9 n=1 Tax=Melanotaenia boesemani TaxID=1250792 RepID=UPI001C0538CF|nr:histone-lysine N-methyltransferase PRDM9 [Melanotaenia boesemani]XP_041847487.1 histone-lysine N-methyltransferase PRDM9 [Melanotaenia boesemani]